MNKIKISHPVIKIISLVLIILVIAYVVSSYVLANSGSTITLDKLLDGLYINSGTSTALLFKSEEGIYFKKNSDDAYTPSYSFTYTYDSGMFDCQYQEETFNVRCLGEKTLMLNDNLFVFNSKLYL